MTDFLSNQLKHKAARRRVARTGLEHLAYHDSLAGVPNRARSMTAVDEAIARSRGGCYTVRDRVTDQADMGRAACSDADGGPQARPKVRSPSLPAAL